MRSVEVQLDHVFYNVSGCYTVDNSTVWVCDRRHENTIWSYSLYLYHREKENRKIEERERTERREREEREKRKGQEERGRRGEKEKAEKREDWEERDRRGGERRESRNGLFTLTLSLFLSASPLYSPILMFFSITADSHRLLNVYCLWNHDLLLMIMLSVSKVRDHNKMVNQERRTRHDIE